MKKPTALLMTAIMILSIATSALPLSACAATEDQESSLPAAATPALAQGSEGAPGEGDATSSMRFTLKAGEYKITKDENGFDVIQMEGFSIAASPGDPMLPHKVYNILVPPEVLWSSLQLKIISAETRVLDGTYEIKPVPSPLPGTSGIETGDLRNDRNANVYETDANFPENSVELLPYSQMRKWKFTKVDFTPFQYNPVSKELTLTESVVIEITHSQSRAKLDEKLMADTVMDDIAAQIFLNYGVARGWYEQEKPIQPQQTYDYVIITTNAIEAGSTKLSSFITHKQNLGHSVLVVTEDDFGSLTGQAPNHRAEKIRQWLKNNYAAMGIEYVLLIGDPHPYESGEGDIPMKMCHPERNQVEYDCEQTPTDYFYADLTGNWDKDGDQYYGEWLHDYPVTGGVDFTPEVYVGRIPVYDEDYTTLDNILQKIIDYETEPETPAPGDISWRESILMPMGFQASGYDGAMLAEQMKDDYLGAAGFTSWRMYQQGNGACGLDSTYTSEEELRGGTVVRDRWAGTDFGIVAWWAHGSATSTSVGYSGCWDGTLMNSAYTTSLDDDHPAFTYQCSCTNGYPENNNNLQYAILKQGGIATVSATRVSWFNTGVGYGEFDGSPTNSGIGYEYVDRLVQGLPGGDALYSAKQSMTPNHQCYLSNWYDFNLYGDPETSIESAGAPTEPNIWVEPTSFDVALLPDTTWNGNMKIGNDGDATLTYSLTDVETTGGPCFKWVAQDPDPLPAGESGIIEAKVHDPDGLADIDYVKIWVTQNPFDWTYMRDDGVAPDEIAGDGIYTCAVYGTTIYGEELGMLLEAKDFEGHTTHTSFTVHIAIGEVAAEGMLALNLGSEEGITSTNPTESTGLNGQDNEITNTVETSAATESGPTTTEPTTTTLPEFTTPETYHKADAGSIDVLLVAADYDTSVAEVQTYLLSFPDITTVDIFNAQIDTPTLAELQGYDAALVWSNYPFYDPVALGDVLADYVDVGGGVVLGTFVWYGPTWDLEGRLINEGYSPFVQAGENLYSLANLGWYNPGHPIMTGISSISGYFRDDVSLTSGANLIAEWDDDHLFVAEKGPVVGVSLYPGIAGYESDWTGDVPTLIHNSLIWSAEPPDCPWLDENPKTGDVEPGSYHNITVSIDTTGLSPGEYCAEIWIANNDPDENPTIVPVQLTVIPKLKPDLVIEKKWEEPAAPKKYLHPENPIDPREPIEEPVGTAWHELYPEYCNKYHLSSWKDNGDGVLSPCDRIDMTDEAGNVDWYHVDEMTVTLFVSLPENPEEKMAIEFVGGYEEIERAIYEPVCTYWHEVYPEFCRDYHIAKWDDTGEKGLSYCDYIYLVDLETGRGDWYHVEEVTWDIIVSPIEAVSPNTYVVWYTIHNKGNATAPAGHSSTLYVDGNVIEHKVVPVALRPSQTYTDTFRTVVECTAPEDKITVCADDYNVTDEWDERNNCLTNIWECPPCEPSIDVNKTVKDPDTGEWVDEITVPVSTIVRFRGVIHNDGTCCNLTDIVVTDVLSESLEYKDNATVDGEPWEPVQVGPNEYQWNFPDKVLSPCQTITIEFDAHAAVPGEDVNTMHAKGLCADTSVYDEDTATVNVIPTENKVYFVPQDSRAPFCVEKEVEIWANASNFYGGQINLIYEPTCANVTNWVRNTTNFPLGGWDSTTNGKEWITFTKTSLPLLTGEYMIGTLTIHCVNDSKEGCETPLDFIAPSSLFDDVGNPVPANWIDGTFECIPGLCGDVAPYPDCNGKVDMGDVILLLNNVSYPGNQRYLLCNVWAGDCRCSGKIDMGDVILLLNNVSYPGNPRYILDCCD